MASVTEAAEPLWVRNKAEPRWVRNKVLAQIMGVSLLTIGRWQKNPAMNFPQPSIINGWPFTNLAEVEEWMRDRVRRPGRRTSDVARS